MGLGRSRLVVALTGLTLFAAACTSDGGTNETTGGTTAGTTVGTVLAPTVDIIESADGGMSVEIPDGALPDGTTLDDITVTPLGADDLRGPLEGAEIRSAYYALEPHGIEFLQPVRITRRFDAAASGFDLADGIPYATLVTSDPEGTTWDVPVDQRLSLDGSDVVLSGSVEHFSYAFAFSGGVGVSVGPDPAGTTVGSSGQLQLAFSTPEEAAVDFEIRGIESDPGLEVVFEDFDSPVMDFYCDDVGTFTYEIELRLDEKLSVEAFATKFHIGFDVDQAREVVILTGTVNCLPADVETPPASDEPVPVPDASEIELTSLEACIVHSPLGGFRSYLRWVLSFGGAGVDVAATVAVTMSNGANDGAPVVAPVVGGTATVESGLPAYGDYDIERAIVENTDGSTVDLTEAFLVFLAGTGGVQVGPEETCTSFP